MKDVFEAQRQCGTQRPGRGSDDILLYYKKISFINILFYTSPGAYASSAGKCLLYFSEGQSVLRKPRRFPLSGQEPRTANGRDYASKKSKEDISPTLRAGTSLFGHSAAVLRAAGTSSSAPETYSGDKSKGETYRVTWALSYYNYLQSAGEQKSKAAFWDKPIWDSSATGGFSLSLFEVGKIGANVAMTLAGVPAWALAGINSGISMGCDVITASINPSAQQGMLGLNLLKDAIGGAAGMLTGGVNLGNEFATAMLAQGVNSMSSLATSGLKFNANGGLDWQMSQNQYMTWGMNSLAGFAGAGLNSGLKVGQTIGSFAQSAFGGNQSWMGNTMGYGFQKMTEGLVSSSLYSAGSAFANGMDWETGQLKKFDMNWTGVLQSTAVAGASGFVSGAVGSGMGGIYDSKLGKMSFLNSTGNDLFYSDKLSKAADTIGSIAGENVDYWLGGTFDINLGAGIGASYANGKGWFRNDGAGGIGLADMLMTMRDMNYVGFQVNNLYNNKGGRSTIDIANAMYYSKDAQASTIGSESEVKVQDFGLNKREELMNYQKNHSGENENYKLETSEEEFLFGRLPTSISLKSEV